MSVPGQEKVWFPPPSPATWRWLTLRGAGLAEPARSALCSELGPEGEGRGLGSHLRTAPPTSPAPRLHVGRPLPRRLRASPAGGSAHARPARGSRRAENFLRVAGPTRPASLARLGVTDASETDFPLFQRKGELARAPLPPSPGPFPLPPPAAVTLGGPLLGSARGGGGGQRLLAVSNVHFLNQTNPPPARSLRAGAGAALSRAGIVGSWAPQKGPERASNWGGAVGHSLHRPPPAPSSRAAHKHPRSHTHNRTRQDDAPSPARPRKRKFPSRPRAPRPPLSHFSAPH